MRCVDVNVLVYAHRTDTPRHQEWSAWLDEARQGPETLGLIGSVAAGFVRIVTHPRIFREPTPTDVALEFVSTLAESRSCRWVQPGPRHWELVDELCRQTDAVGTRVPDAALAAIAIEAGASFVTADHGFVRYPGLRLSPGP